MNKLANRMAEYLIKKGLNPDNREVYAYALECIMNTAASFGTILIVSVLLGRFLSALIWMAFFLPVRHMSGGLHASNHIGCYFLSVSIGIGSLLLAPILLPISWIVFPLLVFSVIVIFLYSPILHANHPLSEERALHMKKASRRNVVIESALIVLLYFLVPKDIAIAAAFGLFAAAASTLIGHFMD